MFVKTDPQTGYTKIIWSHFLISGLLLFAFIAFMSSFFVVSPGEIVLVKNLGSITPTVYTEGIHWKPPFIGKVITINTRGVKVEETALASTNDLQKAEITVAATYQVNGDEGVMKLYRKIGDDNKIESVVAKPNIREAVRAVFAQYTASELVTKRPEVSQKIKEVLENKFDEFGLSVVDVASSDAVFSEAFNQSIEAKVRAEQDALAKKNELEKTKYEAEQQVVRARAEAETIRIQANAIQSQGGKEYVQMKWIEKWDGKLPVTSLGSDTTAMVNLK
jgi:regulator of protease activity HflC (stomatin/prohibitin superfamily)